MFLAQLFFLLKLSFAAPIPATSTSAIISLKPGFFVSEYGFSLHSENTNWQMRPVNKKNILVEYRPTSEKYKVQPALTVRVDPSKAHSTLKSYMASALSEYKRFGFKTLKRKPVKINQQLAYLVDLYSPASQRQLRQVVFFKNKNAVILTCRSSQAKFKTVLNDCNQISRNFTWNLAE